MGNEQKDTINIVPTELLIPTESDRLSVSQKGLFKDVSKWRRTLQINCVLAFVILAANLGLLAWAWTRPDRENGLATIFAGSCSNMSKISTGIHLAINILSTLLLAASNYAVQCLNAPTRKSLDYEHNKRRWVDIGITSFRNFKASQGRHKIIILLLFISSIPLHLVYNSIVVATPAVNEYMALLVAKEFLTGGTWQVDHAEDLYNGYRALNFSTVQYLQDHIGELVQLTNEECNKTYSTTLMNDWSNVLLVTDVSQANHTLIEGWEFMSVPTSAAIGWDWDGRIYEALQIDGEGITTPGAWGTIEPTCNGTAGKDFGAGCKGVSGTVAANITHCLAQPSQPPCSIRLVASSLAVVIICNAIKICCFVATLWLANLQPILTVGDAVSSFMQRFDHATVFTGPMSVQDVQKQSKLHVAPGTYQNEAIMTSQPWITRRSLWFMGVSISRWVITTALLLIVWAICLVLFLRAGITRNGGLGVVDLNALIGSTIGRGLTANIILANVPQLVLSFLYVFYNGVMTSMLVTAEFCRFARHPKGLRVSNQPVGSQRSTYWLQLPLRYSVSLMVSMGILHWLVSRSLFTVSLANYSTNGERAPADDITACGYSANALMGSLICGAVLILALILLGFMRLTPGAPITRTCSLAIQAAASSGRSEDFDCPLMYGVLDHDDTVDNYDDEPVRRRKKVGFGTEVSPLIDGEVYS